MLKILKTFYGFFFRKKFWSVLFVILLVATPIVESLSPYYFKKFVDTIPSLDKGLLIPILLSYVTIRIIGEMLAIARFQVGDILSIDAGANALKSVFSHIHALDFAFHTTKSSGSLISAIKRGDGAFWNLYFSIHYRIVDVFFRFLVLLYFFINLDAAIFLMIVTTFALTSIITFVFVRHNVQARKRVNDIEDEISAVVVDNMINFETVKLFAKELWEQHRLTGIQKKWKKAVWRFVLTFRGFDVAMGVTINASIFFIILYTLNQTLTGKYSIGDFVLVTAFLQSFFPHLYELVWGFRDIAKSYSDIERYFGILDNKVAILDPEKSVKLQSVKGEINIKRVTFEYDKNGKNALKNINLRIRQGQSVAFVGRSGAGKTTLIKLLLRFYDVSKGSITIDGVNVKNFTKSQLRSHFGVVPQEPVLFNNTVLYNLAYANPSASKKELIAAAKIANIHEFIEGLPDGYKTQVGERGIKLSGGQKQRLAIARMILSDPSIIIFDEATSQLDSESEKLIQEAFWKAAKNKTTIIIAHRLSTIQKADKIVVLENGKIQESGSHNELLAKDKSLYGHFWNLQVRM